MKNRYFQKSSINSQNCLTATSQITCGTFMGKGNLRLLKQTGYLVYMTKMAANPIYGKTNIKRFLLKYQKGYHLENWDIA